MNIFYLDSDPRIAAQMQCDKHVVKMVLETAQIISTILGGPYRPTHAKHPSVLWAAKQLTWTKQHFQALLDEYKYRYGKDHACASLVFPDIEVHDEPWTNPPQCMPDIYRQTDCVAAYRNYYIGAKSRFAKWNRGRPAPQWFNVV